MTTKISSIKIEKVNHLNSKVDLPDYANDSKASSYISTNSASHTKTLKDSISKAHSASSSHNTNCTLSGIPLSVSLPSELESLSGKISVCLPASSLLSIAFTSTREELYSLQDSTLAGLVFYSFSSKFLLKTTDNNPSVSNSLLITSGKYNLVEALIAFRKIVTNSIDPDTLPKLDITIATHFEGIADFNQPLADYLTILNACVDEQTLSAIQKAELKRKEREEQAIQQREKALQKQTKSLDSSYEAKRKLAYAALKEATIDLYFLNYKKLVEVIGILVGKNGKATKEEIKSKVLLRLNEILTKYDSSENVDLIANIRIIKEFVTLTLSERVIKQVDSSLERASDLKTPDELASANKNLTLKEKLALKKQNAIKALETTEGKV